MKCICTFCTWQIIACVFLLFTSTNSFSQCGSLVAAVSASESRCAATGSIVINASGGVSPEVYQYSITAGPVTTTFSSLSTFSGLPPGTYTVEIKDVTANCSITKPNIIVPGNYTAPGIFYNSTQPTCMNGTDGSVFVTGQSGGRAPFSYQLISPSPAQVGTVSTDGTFTGLIPGLYYIQLTDSCGGVQTRTQLVGNYTWSILGSSNVSNNCQDITANIYLTNSNGINSPNAVYAGFQYGIVLSPGDTTWFASTPFNFNIGAFRSANIVVKDNCGYVQSFHWTEPAPDVSANANTSNKTCITFTATITGQHNINTSFTEYCLYDEVDSILVSSCQSSPVFNNIPYGTYTIRITDSCYDTTILRTVTATKPSPAVDPNPQYTYTCESFSAAITGQTDTANATYCLYKNGNPVPDTCNTTGIFDSLTYATPYCIQLHTSDICFDTIITRCFTADKQQPAISASVNISNKTCGTFTATVTGQTNITNPTYRLYNGTNDSLIVPDQTNPVFNLLPYGSYCIDIINDSTCYDTTIVKCFIQAAPVADISLSAKGTCSPAGATNIKVNFNAGIAPFTLLLYSPGGTLLNTVTSFGSNYTFNNMPGLPSGQLYKVVATDSCGHQDSATVASNVYYFNRNVTTTARCPSGTSPNGTSDVAIVVTENRGGNFITTIIKKDGATFNQNPDITANSGNTHTFTFLSLAPATYIFDTYSQSCSAHLYDTVIIANYLYPSLTNSTGYICDNGTQSISAVIAGGLPPFQYQIFGSIPASPNINTPYQDSLVFNISNGTAYSLIRLRALDACANASINDVGFISVATPVINVNNICPTNHTDLWVDAVTNASYLWYKRTYNPIDSILVGSGSSYTIPAISTADTGTYIAQTIINSGCEIKLSYINLGISCSIVPVTLENFSATNENARSLLNWITSNEINVNSFIIQRSIDNGKTWQQIANVTSSGNNSVKNNYSFTDNNPQTGTNLYRLQIVGYNGNFTYSNIKQVGISAGSSITVYPNPVVNKDALTIQLTGLKAGIYTINMLSLTGQSIKEKTVTIIDTAPSLLTIPLINIASGSYEIIVKGNGQRYLRPVVIMNR